VVHLERGEPQVHPIQEAHDIENEEERQQPPRHLREGAPFEAHAAAQPVTNAVQLIVLILRQPRNQSQ
jgi:hypothetical protein